MKKFLVVLMILAVAGGVFAQDADITIQGAVKMGLNVENEGDGDFQVVPYSDDVDNGTPLRAELTFRAAWENVGVNIRLREDLMKTDAAGALHDMSTNVGFAYAYANALNDMITIGGGKLGDSVWATEGDWDDSYDSVLGVRVEDKHIEGLNIGVAFDAGAFADAAGVYRVPFTVPQFLQETVIGVKYASDPFTVVAAVKLDSNADAPKLSTGAYDTNPLSRTDEEMKALFSVNITAVPALTAIIDGELGALNSDNVQIDIHEKFGFQISDALEAHIVLVEAGGLDKDASGPIGFEAKPGVSFAIIPDKFTAKLDLGILTNFEFDPLHFFVKPGVEWTYANNAALSVYWKGTFGDDVGTDVYPKNLFHVDFVWTF
jgi:hypothetical protein